MSTPKTLIELSGGAPRIPSWQNSALIIIDHQAEYTTGAVPLAGIDEAVNEIADLLVQARNAGAPVFHVIHHGKPGGGLFDPQREFAAIIDGIGPQVGEHTIVKSLPNSFAGTALDAELKKTGRTSLIIAGFMTHMCVSATTRAALDHSYVSTVVAAACATRDLPDALGEGVIKAAEVQRIALAELADRSATVVRNAAALV